MENNIVIRTANISDLEKLKIFFIKAYGENTIFQDDGFLLHFFNNNNNEIFNNNIIIINENGDIVSHYGGLEHKIRIKNKIHTIIWGVNAFTLPENRGKGYNSSIVDILKKRNKINGVIGFTYDTSLFYKKIGYNLFDFKKFIRYVLILDHNKTKKICNYLNQNCDIFLNQKNYNHHTSNDFTSNNVVELTLDNINDYDINLDSDFPELTTTYRTKEFLIWRFLKNPYIKYCLYGIIQNKSIIAYVALLEEVSNPFDYKINRIIDLYGNKNMITLLLNNVINVSILKNHIYIDFSMLGKIYKEELESLNFIQLEGEDYCIIPQITSPLMNRHNNDYLCMYSEILSDEISSLSYETVYFTRMDSDRDRLAKIFQIKK